MRLPVLFLTLLGFGACKNDDSKPAPAPTAVSDETAATDDENSAYASAGKLIVTFEPKEGAGPETVAGAKVSVAGHPEADGVTDEQGLAVLNSVTAGTISIIATSSEATALTTTAAAYGIKIDDVVVKAGEENDIGSHVFKETGGVSGIVSFFENPNNLDLVGSDIFVPGTSFAAKTDENGRFSLQGLPVGNYALRIQHVGFAVLDMEVSIAEGQITELEPVALSLSRGPEGTITIHHDMSEIISGVTKRLSTSRTVSVNLTYDSDAALMRISDEPSFLSRAWEPVASTYAWTFAADGEQTLYIQFSDLNGLESAPFADTLIVDTENPSINSLKVLYGWGQSATRNIEMHTLASDSGSGIKEIAFSNDAFATAATWSSFQAAIAWQLTAGVGGKTVSAKVRDYAGRESAMASDGITLGSNTVIANLDYQAPIVLRLAQSPFAVENGVTIVFASDLTIEPGVTVQLLGEAKIDVRGVFKAVGTAANHINIGADDVNLMACGSPDGYGTLRFDNALPGVTEANEIAYVDFKKISFLYLNGGSFANSTLDGRCSSGTMGITEKRGLDPLTFTSNAWTNWSTGLKATGGTANTTLANNTGSIRTLLHLAGAQNVAVRDMSLTAIEVNGMPLFYLASGSAITSNLNFSGTTDIVFEVGGTQTFNLTDISVANCDSIVRSQNTGTLNISNSTFSNCNYGILFENSTAEEPFGPVNITQSTIFARENLVHSILDEQVFTGTTLNLSFSNNEINCSHPDETKTCSMFHQARETFNMASPQLGTIELSMTNNNISCLGIRCVGFVYQKSPSGSSCSGTVNLELTNNYWADKTSGLLADIENNIQVYDESGMYADHWFIATDSADLTWSVTQNAQANAAINSVGDPD
jgi:hypothetical protein